MLSDVKPVFRSVGIWLRAACHSILRPTPEIMYFVRMERINLKDGPLTQGLLKGRNVFAQQELRHAPLGKPLITRKKQPVPFFRNQKIRRK